MAAKPSLSSTEGLKKLEEQLTCPICLDHFTNPKILPCFHSFCLHCLEGVPTDIEEGSYYIACPTCRLACSVPDKGLATLPASFVINNFIEVYSLMKKVSGDTHASCDNCNKTDANRYCKQCAQFFCLQCLHHHDNWKPNINHQTISLEEVASTAHQLPTTRPEVTEYCTDHNKPLEIYCETCQELICHNCTVKKHRDHDYDVASDVYSKNRDVIVESSLQPLNQEAERLYNALKVLAAQRDAVMHQAEIKQEEIQRQIVTRIEEMGKKLREDIESVVEYKVSVLKQQIKEVDTALGQVRECRDHVEQCVRVGTPRQILTTKAQIVSRAETVLEQIKDKTFQPLVEADIVVERIDTMKGLQSDIGEAISANCSSSLPNTSIALPHIPVIGQDSTITVSLTFPDGSSVPVSPSSIKCSLTPPSDSCQPIQCPVEESSQLGQYNVVFTPVAKGYHQLHFTLSVPVSVAMEMPTKPLCAVTRLNGPTGVAIDDYGQVVVCEGYGNRITILDSKGEKVTSFCSKGSKMGEVTRPQGVVVTPQGTVLVADWSNHRIQEFTMQGYCKTCVGNKGKGSLKFSYPSGIVINKVTRQVFVAEWGNCQVQVLNPDFTFSHMFGCKGLEQHQFQELHDVTVDNEGFVYVTDRGANRIKKFTTKGKFVASFDTEESELGGLCKPSGITIANELLFVNNEGKYITVLTSSGEHFGYIEKSTKDMSTNSGFLQGITSCANTGSLYFYCIFDKAVKFYHYE